MGQTNSQLYFLPSVLLVSGVWCGPVAGGDWRLESVPRDDSPPLLASAGRSHRGVIVKEESGEVGGGKTTSTGAPRMRKYC